MVRKPDQVVDHLVADRLLFHGDGEHVVVRYRLYEPDASQLHPPVILQTPAHGELVELDLVYGQVLADLLALADQAGLHLLEPTLRLPGRPYFTQLREDVHGGLGVGQLRVGLVKQRLERQVLQQNPGLLLNENPCRHR